MVDIPFSIANVIIPKGGPKTVPVNIDFTGIDTHEVDLSQLVEQSRIEYVQCVFVDNSDNPNDLEMQMDLTGQRIIAPSGSQGYYSILQPNPPKLTFTTTAGAFNVHLQFLNVPVQPCVWGGAAGGTVGGLTDAQLRATPVDVLGPLTDTELRATPVDVDTGLVQGLTDTQLRATPVPVTEAANGGAYTDHSIANLSGASENLMNANANRKFLFIHNPAGNNMGVNLIGGAAAIGTAGTVTLPPGGIILLDKYVTTSAIKIIGTLNDDVTAYEL